MREGCTSQLLILPCRSLISLLTRPCPRGCAPAGGSWGCGTGEGGVAHPCRRSPPQGTPPGVGHEGLHPRRHRLAEPLTAKPEPLLIRRLLRRFCQIDWLDDGATVRKDAGHWRRKGRTVPSPAVLHGPRRTLGMGRGGLPAPHPPCLTLRGPDPPRARAPVWEGRAGAFRHAHATSPPRTAAATRAHPAGTIWPARHGPGWADRPAGPCHGPRRAQADQLP